MPGVFGITGSYEDCYIGYSCIRMLVQDPVLGC